MHERTTDRFKTSQTNHDTRTIRTHSAPIKTTGEPQICLFHVAKPVHEIEVPRDMYFLTGSVVTKLERPKGHAKMTLHILRCSQKSREHHSLRNQRATHPQIEPTGRPQICAVDVGRPVREIEAPRVPYFLTGREVRNLRWPKLTTK